MMMCLGMVIVMTFYNLLMNETGGPIYIKEIALELLIGFIIALLIEICIVGPCAKKLYSYCHLINLKNKYYRCNGDNYGNWNGVLYVIFRYGYDVFTWWTTRRFICFHLFYDFIKNFIMAYPLQLIIMGPLVRFLFAKFVMKKKSFNVA